MQATLIFECKNSKFCGMMDLFNDIYDKLTCLRGDKIESIDLSFLTDDFLKKIIFDTEYSDELCSKIISLPNYIAESMNDIPNELFPDNYVNRLISIACNINEGVGGHICLNNFQLQLLLRLFRNGFSKKIVNCIVSPSITYKTDTSGLCSIIHQLSLKLDEFHLKKFVKHILEVISPLYKMNANQFYTHISTSKILGQFKSFNLTTIFHPLNNIPLIPSIHLLDVIDGKYELWEYLIRLWSDELLNSMLSPSSQIIIGSYLSRLLKLHIKRCSEKDFGFISSGIYWRLTSYEKCARLSGIAMAIVTKELNCNEQDNEENDDATFDEFECPQSNSLKAAMKDFNELVGDVSDLIYTCDDKMGLDQQSDNSIDNNYLLPHQKSHLSKPFYLRQILERIQGNLIRGEVDFELVKNLSGGSPLDKIENSDQKLQRITQALVYLHVILDRNPPDAEIESLSFPLAKSLLSLTTIYNISQKVECLDVNGLFTLNNSIPNYPTKIVLLRDLISKGLTKLILVSFKPLVKFIASEIFNTNLSIQSKILLLESAIDGVDPNQNRTFKNVHPSLAAFGVVELLDAIEQFINNGKSYSNIIHLSRDNGRRIFNIDSTGIILIARVIDLIVCLKISSGNGWILLGLQAEQIHRRLMDLKILLLKHLPTNCRLMESLSLVENYI
ncbi:hypothetical protein BMR1_01G01100 [Babesia microti strain RI]|uniref:Uncharacterized protein n=1 Tax=Babesia microti (strain RI) TaxID=1133968 RepID=I7IFC6_BABMR|nr:hypothetical protein BMR1_01G01100 [Babesia microti strain RI]CCF72686.1 hypothetical protein BMR1_01G01100 [Babesia microti strain RI]|eukprot:XP_012647295.1 hypothetical protein BMR1_01G01100 [Babesia microti strain RI]